MTTTYDPFHPKYFDETDLRHEMDRVFDLCHGCRLCFKYCTSFPTLFEFIDRDPQQNSETLTKAEQDQVVDECFQCKLCYVNCPYTPGQSDWELDFPRLMMRAEQVRHRNERRPISEKITDAAFTKTDLNGRAGSMLAPIANMAIGTPNSPIRKIMDKTLGIAAERILPPYARTRFTTWFTKRGGSKLARAKQGHTVLFPTCLVEYQNAGIGHDAVKVLEHNGIECTLPSGLQCCGAPALHQGDVDTFRKGASHNIKILAAALRASDAAGDPATISILQPTCGYILKKDYVDYVGGADAELVASRTQDVSEYLWSVHKGEGTALDAEFTGDVPASTTYHAPCHLRAQNIGLKGRDLLKLTGTKVTVVAECSAVDGTWGLRAENVKISRKIATKLATAITKANSESISGDCTLANGGIVLETGHMPVHPVQQMARAYGFAEEPSAIEFRERQQRAAVPPTEPTAPEGR
jgi:glycerol-3-phosphate dehydrogenase subunit C